MKTLKFKLFLYQAKGMAISIINLVAILTIAYFFNKLTEMLIFTLTYNVIRKDFTLAVHGNDFTASHSKAVKICRLITFVIQFISIIFIISIDISKFLNTFLACVLGILNFVFKFYIENYLGLELKLRNPDMLKKMCDEANISENAYKRLYMKYIEKKSIKEIAELECVEEMTIGQSIRRSRIKLKGGSK